MRLHGGRDYFQGTGADPVETAADNVETNADPVESSVDAHGSASDAMETSADGADAMETSADGADAVGTAADPVETSLEEYSEDEYSEDQYSEHSSEAQDDAVVEEQDDSRLPLPGQFASLGVENGSNVLEEQDGGVLDEARMEAPLSHLSPQGSQPVLVEAVPAPESGRGESATAVEVSVGADAVETAADPVETSVEQYLEDSWAAEQDGAVDEANSNQINLHEPEDEARAGTGQVAILETANGSNVEAVDEANSIQANSNVPRVEATVPGVDEARGEAGQVASLEAANGSNVEAVPAPSLQHSWRTQPSLQVYLTSISFKNSTFPANKLVVESQIPHQIVDLLFTITLIRTSS